MGFNTGDFHGDEGWVIRCFEKSSGTRDSQLDVEVSEVMGVALNHPVMTMTPRKPDDGIPYFFRKPQKMDFWLDQQDFSDLFMAGSTGFFSHFSDSVDPAKKSS